MTLDTLKYGYAFEKASLAARSMAISDQSLKDRIIDAYRYHLNAIDPDDKGKIPPSALQDFKFVKAQITDNGRISPSKVHAMSDDDVLQLARDIIDLTYRIRDIYAHPEDYANDY